MDGDFFKSKVLDDNSIYVVIRIQRCIAHLLTVLWQRMTTLTSSHSALLALGFRASLVGRSVAFGNFWGRGDPRGGLHRLHLDSYPATLVVAILCQAYSCSARAHMGVRSQIVTNNLPTSNMHVQSQFAHTHL